MKRYTLTTLLLGITIVFAMSCGQSSNPSDPMDTDTDTVTDSFKRDFGSIPPNFVEKLTPEYLEATWSSVMGASIQYVQISDVVNIADGGVVTGVGENYPDEPEYICTLEIPANALLGHPELTSLRFVIELPPYDEQDLDTSISFDVFCEHPLPGLPNMELHFNPPLKLTICAFPRVASLVDYNEYVYQVVKNNEEYSFRNLQQITRNSQTDLGEFFIWDIFVEGSDRPDRSGTVINETDVNDED